MEAVVNDNVDPALLSVSQMCKYMSIGETTARYLLSEHRHIFAVKIGNRLYANKKRLDQWIDSQTGI